MNKLQVNCFKSDTQWLNKALHIIKSFYDIIIKTIPITISRLLMTWGMQIYFPSMHNTIVVRCHCNRKGPNPCMEAYLWKRSKEQNVDVIAGSWLLVSPSGNFKQRESELLAGWLYAAAAQQYTYTRDNLQFIVIFKSFNYFNVLITDWKMDVCSNLKQSHNVTYSRKPSPLAIIVSSLNAVQSQNNIFLVNVTRVQ